MRRWHLGKNRVEKRLQVRTDVIGHTGLPGRSDGVDYRKIRLFFGGAQLDKQIKGLDLAPDRVRRRADLPC